MNKLTFLFIAAAAAHSVQASTIVDYEIAAGTVQVLAASYALSGLTVSTPAQHLELSNGGLGVVGGVQDYFIDGLESVRFSFDAGSATAVSFEAPLLANLNYSVSRPQSSLTGYGVGGAALGTYAFLPFSQPNYTTALAGYFGSTPLSGFSVTGNQVALAISKVTFTAATSAAPEPSTLFLLAAGLVVCAVCRVSRAAQRR